MTKPLLPDGTLNDALWERSDQPMEQTVEQMRDASKVLDLKINEMQFVAQNNDIDPGRSQSTGEALAIIEDAKRKAREEDDTRWWNNRRVVPLIQKRLS